MDPEALKRGLNIGCCPMFSNKSKVSSVKILATDVQRTKQKPITISSVSKILKEAKIKLNLRKKPTLLLDIHGNELTNETMALLCEDSLVIVK